MNGAIQDNAAKAAKAVARNDAKNKFTFSNGAGEYPKISPKISPKIKAASTATKEAQIAPENKSKPPLKLRLDMVYFVASDLQIVGNSRSLWLGFRSKIRSITLDRFHTRRTQAIPCHHQLQII